ncbi:MAG: exopolysaccharide biosynthesis polyprenyl glycosylphosphotransferase [bacterium]|nr:MAG: exopolysaccharide biosynthesis polyprenyl glycosylphosphotransferase [bacterium]
MGWPELQEAAYEQIPLEREADTISLSRCRSYLLCKRITDIAVALLFFILFLPIMPVVAILIKLDSPGPILFKQRRVGKNGKNFDFYKFRSMVHDAENVINALRPLSAPNGPIFKLKDDPRVTPVGRFLRRSSLDELPQLINVLKGDMSIVGPRPNLPSEVAHYQPWQKRRLNVTPGITCLWQIAGRSHIGFDEWMRLDLEYIQKRSYATDLKIMLKTLPAVIARKGAY